MTPLLKGLGAGYAGGECPLFYISTTDRYSTLQLSTPKRTRGTPSYRLLARYRVLCVLPF